MFSIDGIEYNVKCTIEREAEIKASEISGLMLDRSLFWDVLGTYMNYDIRLDMPLRNRDRYATLVDQLSEPVDGHAFVLPYNNGTLQLTARVESVRDVWEKLPSGYTFWKGLRFTVTGNAPTRQMSLGQVLLRGLAPLPNVAEPAEGATYTYTSGGWVPATVYDDADDNYY